MFLSAGGLLERGTSEPEAVATAGLTIPMSWNGWHFFHTDSPFVEIPHKWGPPTTPGRLLSFRKRGQAPSSLHRIRRSFRHGLIDWRYRSIPKRTK